MSASLVQFGLSPLATQLAKGLGVDPDTVKNRAELRQAYINRYIQTLDAIQASTPPGPLSFEQKLETFRQVSQQFFKPLLEKLCVSTNGPKDFDLAVFGTNPDFPLSKVMQKLLAAATGVSFKRLHQDAAQTLKARPDAESFGRFTFTPQELEQMDALGKAAR